MPRRPGAAEVLRIHDQKVGPRFMIDPARPFSARPSARSADVGTVELSRLLQRARDERFRLLKLLQEARSSVEDGGGRGGAVEVAAVPLAEAERESSAAPPIEISPPTPTGSSEVATTTTATSAPGKAALPLQELIGKVATLNERMDDKLARLGRREAQAQQAMQQLGGRVKTDAETLKQACRSAQASADRLDQLRYDAGQLSDTVTGQLERFDEHLRTYAGEAEAELKRQLDAAAQDAGARLEAQMRARMKAYASELDAAHASVAKRLTQRFDELADQLETRARGLLDQAAEVSDRVRREVRKQVVDAMAQTQDLQEMMASRLADDRQAHRQQLADLVDETDLRLLTQTREWDELLRSYEQRIRDRVEAAGRSSDGSDADSAGKDKRAAA